MKCFYYLKDKSRNGKQRSAPELNHQTKFGVPELYEEKAPNLRVFSLSELRQATHDFNRLLKIGEGGFGCVYKGTIKLDSGNGNPDTTVVAVKRLNRDGFQGHKQWVAEVQFLGVVEHPNVVKLIGYCGVDGERGIQRLLVYEYMANRSLEVHLFNRENPALDWNTRLRILLGAAQGLDYLHEGLEIQVIFRDFKSSNVLLDEKFNPKLSDFGLAREGPMPDRTHVSTAVVGTQGYAAPDYIQTGHLTAKSDVWSFGVVIYEVLTGRRSLNRNLPKPEQKLLEWVQRYPPESKKFGSIIDLRLENHFSINTARKVAKLADRCLLKSPKDRPTMREVVECLKEIVSGSGGEGSEESSMEWLEGLENELNGSSQGEVTESWRRRMAHLAKLGEHAEGAASRRRFIFLQRAKVP